MKQTGYLTIGGQVLPFPQPSESGQDTVGLDLLGQKLGRPLSLVYLTSATRRKSMTWRTWGRWAAAPVARCGRCASGRQAMSLLSR